VEAVRRATPPDLDRCRALVAEALAAAEDQRGGPLLVAAATRSDAADLVARWGGDEDARLFVGTFDGAVVGVAAGWARSDGPARIECLYVEPGARAVGVGAGLVEALVEWFRSRGCADVDAVALPGDRSTKQLLESAGFKARLLVLHRSLR